MTTSEADQYYTVLELPSGASIEQVKQAYRDLVKVWHPDRFTQDPRLQKKAEERLKKINEAYAHLCRIVPNEMTQVRAKATQPQPTRPTETWVSHLKDGQTVRIVDLNPDDSYFNLRRELSGTIIRVWGDVQSSGHGWFCIRAVLQTPGPNLHRWSSGDVIYFSSVRVSRV